eukprot:TRINITY_DN33243_c0_g2_i1.p1 TRINITY_DN33243_c0_g2~~TRINITY_DN33243_c0_g2_i1.p1  ORF type:complete len:401 (-),score=57.11 TRINITY_DN33243_c0_g2_i1:499-1701(-)
MALSLPALRISALRPKHCGHVASASLQRPNCTNLLHTAARYQSLPTAFLSSALMILGRRVLRSKQRRSATLSATSIDRQTCQPPISKGHYAEISQDIRMHYAECRPMSEQEERGTCILLHGFPDYHGSWRAQMPVLAAAGYRVIAPDLRGYGQSTKPEGVENYSEAEVTSDILALAEIVSPNRPLSMLAGHDWGAFVAWAAAKRSASICDRLAILNVPHPIRFAEGLQTFQQLRKSWYTFAFQVPWIPETAFELADFALLRHVLRTDPFVQLPKGVIEEHIKSFSSNPGSTSSAINYYRAAGRGLWEDLSEGPAGMLQQILASVTATKKLQSSGADGIIHVPVQVIWGQKDRYLGSELAVPPRDKVPNLRPTRFLDGTHWVHWDCPEEVNAELLRFLEDE